MLILAPLIPLSLSDEDNMDNEEATGNPPKSPPSPSPSSSSSSSSSPSSSGRYSSLEPEGESEQADPEEDVLYLRLLALRSMAPELDDEKLQKAVTEENSTTDSNNLEAEMTELLEEADLAAAASEASEEEKMIDDYMRSVLDKNSSNLDVKVAHDLPYLVQKLRNSLARSANPENVDEPENDTTEHYSPTQSPIYDPSFPNSPEVLCEVCSPPLAVLSPPPRPSEEEEILTRPPPKPVDMELGSENEAEIQFFKEQKEQIFPSSVWDFGKVGVEVAKEKVEEEKKEKEQKAERLEKVEKKGEEEEDNDNKKMAQKKDSNQITRVISTTTPTRRRGNRRRRRTKSANRGGVAVIKTVADPEEKSSSVVETEKQDEEDEDENTMRARLLENILQKRAKEKEKEPCPAPAPTATQKSQKKPGQQQKQKTATTSKILKRKLKDSSVLIEERPSKVMKKSLAVKKLENDHLIQQRYFPNLIKSVIVPLDSIDSSEGEDDVRQDKKLFTQKLDLLLKDCRKKSTVAVSINNAAKKRTPPPKPIRKNPPGKESNCKISHLSLLYR